MKLSESQKQLLITALKNLYHIIDSDSEKEQIGELIERLHLSHRDITNNNKARQDALLVEMGLKEAEKPPSVGTGITITNPEEKIIIKRKKKV